MSRLRAARSGPGTGGSPRNKKKRPRRRRRFLSSRGSVAPDPRRIGAPWDVPSGRDPASGLALDSSPFGWFSALLHRSGGSGCRWPHARSDGRGGEVAAAQLPRANAERPLRRPLRDAMSPALRGRVFVVLARGERLLRRNRHLLRRHLARNEGDVDLFARLPVLVRLAADEDRRAGLDRAPEYVVRERVLDEALDRAAQRP